MMNFSITSVGGNLVVTNTATGEVLDWVDTVMFANVKDGPPVLQLCTCQFTATMTAGKAPTPPPTPTPTPTPTPAAAATPTPTAPTTGSS